MLDQFSRIPKLVVALAAGLALSGVAACAGTKPALAPPAGSTDAGSDRAAPVDAPDRSHPIDVAAPPADAAACTTQVQCVLPSGRYCGVIGDGCLGTLDCGVCPGTEVCDKGLCVGGPDCVALACQAAATSAAFCGTVGDGCGGALACGGCGASQICNGGLCVPAGCVPLTCNTASGQYCGTIGDGCGGTLDCGACAGAGATCGGGGIPQVCGAATGCTPVTCLPAGGGQYCGAIGDGCGGALDCGACPGGKACGGDGTPGVCPGAVVTGGCQNLQCQVPVCTGGAQTTLSGTVYDPAGQVPLYNAVVYVPNAPLAAIPEGVSCDRCAVSLSGAPIATALSDTSGRFTLTGVPAGANIPLVIQIGKWRRQITIAAVAPCVDNPIANPDLTRLPSNRGEGNIPKIGLTTGGSDALECLLRKIGVADSEFTTSAGAGRVNLFVGGEPDGTLKGRGAASFTAALGGGTFPTATTLWGDPDLLLHYDLLIFSCEGGQYASVKAPFIDNIKRYVDAGGRLFNDHLHYYWLRSGPAPFPSTADYIGNGTAPPTPITAQVDTSFPKGLALSSWLGNVGASTTAGQIDIYDAQHSVAATTAPTQRWIYLDQNPNDTATPKRTATEYLTFNTPVEAPPDSQCGRVVLTDIHVKSAPHPAPEGKDDSDPTKPFPSACLSTSLSAQEKALEFLLFDLSSCVQPDTAPPTPPLVPPPGAPTAPPLPVSLPPAVPPPPPPPPPPIVP
jgi:hypothetical protein